MVYTAVSKAAGLMALGVRVPSSVPMYKSSNIVRARAKLTMGRAHSNVGSIPTLYTSLIRESSNGRTLAFDSSNLGSNPSSRTNFMKNNTKHTQVRVNWRGIAKLIGIPVDNLSDEEIKVILKNTKLPRVE